MPEITSLGATILALSPILPELSKALAENLGLEFDVLNDSGNKVALKYGLVFRLAESLQPIYQDFGIDLNEANGDTSNTLPLPATFILNTQGEILLASMDVDYTVRLAPEKIITALQKFQ